MSDSEKLTAMFDCYFENKKEKDSKKEEECKAEAKNLEKYDGEDFKENELNDLYNEKGCKDFIDGGKIRNRYKRNKTFNEIQEIYKEIENNKEYLSNDIKEVIEKQDFNTNENFVNDTGLEELEKLAKELKKIKEKAKEEKLAKETRDLEEAESRKEAARIAAKKAKAALAAEQDELKRKELAEVAKDKLAKEEEEKAKVIKEQEELQKEIDQKWKEDEPELDRHKFEDKKEILKKLLIAKREAAEKADDKSNYQTAIEGIDKEEDINYPVSNDKNFSFWLKNKFLNLDNWNYSKRIKIYNEYINKLKEKSEEEERLRLEQEAEEKDDDDEDDEEPEPTVDNNGGCSHHPMLDEAKKEARDKKDEFCKELNKTSECNHPNCASLIEKLIIYYKQINTYHSKTTTYNKQIKFLKNNMSKIVNLDKQPSETKLLNEIKKFVEAIKLWENETYITRVHDDKELHYKVINQNSEECFVEYIQFRPIGERLVKTGTNKYNLSRLKGAIQQGVEYKKADNKIEEKIEELLKSKESEKKSIATNTDPIEQAKEVVTPVVDDAELEKLQDELEKTKKNLAETITKSQEHEESAIKKLEEQQQQELQKKLDEQNKEFKEQLEVAAEKAEREKEKLVAKKTRFKKSLKIKKKEFKESKQKIEELNQKIKTLREEDAEQKEQLEAEKERIKNLLQQQQNEQEKLKEQQDVVEQKTNTLHEEQIKLQKLKSQHEKELEELRKLEKKQKEREEEKRKQVKEKFMELKGKLIESALKKLKETDSIGDIKIEGIKKSYPKLHDKIKRFLIFKEDELIKAHHAKFYSDNIKRNNEKLLETLKLIPGEPFLGIKGLPLMAAFGSEVKKKEEEEVKKEKPKEEEKKEEKPKEEEKEINLKKVKENVRKFIIRKAEFIFNHKEHEKLSVKEYLKTL